MINLKNVSVYGRNLIVCCLLLFVTSLFVNVNCPISYAKTKVIKKQMVMTCGSKKKLVDLPKGWKKYTYTVTDISDYKRFYDSSYRFNGYIDLTSVTNKVGKVTVVAKRKGYSTIKWTIKVSNPQISSTSEAVFIGESFSLSITGSLQNKIKWSSENKNVASVDS